MRNRGEELKTLRIKYKPAEGPHSDLFSLFLSLLSLSLPFPLSLTSASQCDYEHQRWGCSKGANRQRVPWNNDTHFFSQRDPGNFAIASPLACSSSGFYVHFLGRRHVGPKWVSPMSSHPGTTQLSAQRWHDHDLISPSLSIYKEHLYLFPSYNSLILSLTCFIHCSLTVYMEHISWLLPVTQAISLHLIYTYDSKITS